MISCISTVFTWFVWNPVNTLQVVKFHRNLGFAQYLWSLPVLLTQPLAQALQARDWTSLPFPSLNKWLTLSWRDLFLLFPLFENLVWFELPWVPQVVISALSSVPCHLCSLAFAVPLCPLLQWFPSLGRRDCPIYTDYSTVREHHFFRTYF